MEIAIPLIALGSMYIISNQPKPEDKKKEGFSSLPNTDIPHKNFPDDTANNPELDVSSKLATVNQYDGRSVYTDKYFNPYAQNSLVKKAAEGEASQHYSMTGDKVNNSYFNHNNMVPFFGGKIRSAVDPKSNERVESTQQNHHAKVFIKTSIYFYQRTVCSNCTSKHF